MPHRVNCCCCEAHTGLRVLGYWWAFECVFALFVCWLPMLWIESVALLITFLPPFIVFYQMTQHHDDVEHRHKLFKTYMTFGVIIGIPLQFISTLIINYNMAEIQWRMCLRFTDPTGVNCPYPASNTAGYIWGMAIFNALVYLAFRMYFVSIMKKYWE